MLKGSVGDLLDEFRDQEYISKSAAEAKQLEIRIVCSEERLVCRDCTHMKWFKLTFQQFSPGVSSTTSTTELQSSKRKLSSATVNPRDSGFRNVRKSAWPPASSKPKFSRSPQMVTTTFMRTTADIVGPIVFFADSDKIETIDIANDWRGGYKKYLQKEDYSKTGYIGQGSAKQVIYVRCYCTWLLEEY